MTTAGDEEASPGTPVHASAPTTPLAPIAPSEPSAAATPAPPAIEPVSESGAASPHVRDRLLGVLVFLLVMYTCAVAEAVLVPILVAILLGLILAPAVRFMERWRVPRLLGALLAVCATFGIIGSAIAALASPARAWLSHMPAALVHLQAALRDLRRPLQAATEATRELSKLGALGDTQTVHTVEASPGFLAHLLSVAPGALAGLVVTVFLTFLFLLHGDALLRKFVTMAPHLRAKRDIVLATREAQHELSIYMITITVINLALGLATVAALHLLHVPDPWLWGGVAALMNYAPFIGPLITAAALVVAGFAEFSSPLSALAAPAAFLGLHLLEGELVTPHLVGRRLALDPVMVFLALIVLGWMWGVAGLLLAVPLLACAKIVAERILEGDALATLLGR